jgi:hypothetical protein
MNVVQLAADREEERSIQIYGLWRSWADQMALREVEKRLRGEGADTKRVRSSSPLVLRRGVWAVILVAAVAAVALIVVNTH